MRAILRAVTAFLVIWTSAAAYAGEAEESGEDEYRRSCLNCHGNGGRGDGPMAEFLNVPPTDLTRLTQNNDGLFPIIWLYQVIDGTTLVPTHGDRAMPIWGERYLEQDGGQYKSLSGEQGVRLRILELIAYIQSIQQ